MVARQFEGLGGVALAADILGPEEGPPVVLLHGGGQTRHAWRDFTRELAEHGYYAISLDTRGHGQSGWAADQDYSLDALVADLYAVIATLTRKPALVGASLGGTTSIIAVGESITPLASSLVLVDVVPNINKDGAKRIKDFMSANMDGFDSVEAVADAVSAYLPNRPKPKNPAGLMKNLRTGEDGRLYWHWDPAFMGRIGRLDPDKSRDRVRAAAGNIQIPTLLVRGSESEIVDDENSSEFLALVPSAEIIEVPGTGHMVAGDDNNAFKDAVMGFLLRHRGK